MTQENRHYLAQFRELGSNYFTTDCDWAYLEAAKRYVGRIYAALLWVAEGQVVEKDTRQVVYHIGITP